MGVSIIGGVRLDIFSIIGGIRLDIFSIIGGVRLDIFSIIGGVRLDIFSIIGGVRLDIFSIILTNLETPNYSCTHTNNTGNKMKNKKYHTVGTVPISIDKWQKEDISIPLTLKYMTAHFPGTSLKKWRY
jgi:hypothetical protein